MKYAASIVLTALLLFSIAGVATASTPPAATIPTISIIDVVAGQTVTIQTANFPPDQTFRVTMGKIGTRGIDGIEVDSTNSEAGGVLTETYTIPPELRDEALISIRLESPQGFFSYNWFFNTTASVPVTGTTATPAPTATATLSPTPAPTGTTTPATAVSGIPTITITGVVRDQQVSIQAANFPPDQNVRVMLGKMGTRGISGIVVDTTPSGSTGSFSGIYSIPSELAGMGQIAIRLESTGGYFGYNWFFNNTTTP